MPFIPPAMPVRSQSDASVRSFVDQTHGRDAHATRHVGQAWQGEQLSPKLVAGSPVAAVYDRRNGSVAKSTAGFQPALAMEAGRDACATKIRILGIPSIGQVGDRTRNGGHRPPLQNSIQVQCDSTRSECLTSNATRCRFYSTLLAAGLGIILTLPARAADPYADNPFAVPYRQAPTDPALRWAGFQSRVGTYLPTNPYHFWRFDVSNRAEMQDVYWSDSMVAATVPKNWNGSFTTLQPGKMTQAWRNAVLREMNLPRYYRVN